MILGIWEYLEKTSASFREWIIQNQSNPILWIGLVLAGLIVFMVTYNALQTEK